MLLNLDVLNQFTYRDPNKFSQDYSSNTSDYIPGESDRDRRLRLRAMERKTRLGSAKSNTSAYSIPPKPEPPTFYQENLKFPENTQIETSNVQPARPLAFEQDDFRHRNDDRQSYEYKPQHSEFTKPVGNFEQRPISIGSTEETT